MIEGRGSYKTTDLLGFFCAVLFHVGKSGCVQNDITFKANSIILSLFYAKHWHADFFWRNIIFYLLSFLNMLL